MADGFDKSEVSLREVAVRPARADERRRWDALMAEHHYLGFKQFAGRGLRHVAEWRGHWLALAGWQSGAFKCAPRDRWLGWHPSVQFRRLHLIGNNTRFLILPDGEKIKNLASRTLGLSLRRLSGDWQAAHGHVLELAETFVDPSLFEGTCYRASGWERVGLTQGFARHNGAYTDAKATPKEMHVRPLRPDARRRLSDPAERPEWGAPKAVPMAYGKGELRSLRDLFAAMPDCRRGQGRKHRLETVLAIVALAKLSGLSGPAACERFGRGLSQEELRALGAWRHPRSGEWVPPSDSTFCRVMADLDPEALQDVLRRWAAPRAPAERGGAADGGDVRDAFDRRALAADGKRIRGANRNTGDDRHFETVTLVAHDGRPVASRCLFEKGGEIAATAALLEDVDVRGRLLTLDALPPSFDAERRIVDMAGAHYMFTIKENCLETRGALAAMDWDGAGARRHAAPPEKAHGRIETRSISALDLPKGMLRFEHARQGFRVVRERAEVKTGKASRETAYGICSVGAGAAGPEQLLAWNRGHWMVENGNHHPRDATLGEDASRVRARHAPANNAAMNNIALAVVRHRGFRFVPPRHHPLHDVPGRRPRLHPVARLDAGTSPAPTVPKRAASKPPRPRCGFRPQKALPRPSPAPPRRTRQPPRPRSAIPNTPSAAMPRPAPLA